LVETICWTYGDVAEHIRYVAE